MAATNEEVMEMEVMEEEKEMIDELQVTFDELEECLSEMTSETAVELCDKYQNILCNERSDDSATKIKEKCIYRLRFCVWYTILCYRVNTLLFRRLARIYSEQRLFDSVMTLLKSNNAFFAQIPKAKTAKIVRNIIDIVSKVPDSMDVQVSLCENVVEWCVAEKRTFLRHRIECKVKLYIALLFFKMMK